VIFNGNNSKERWKWKPLVIFNGNNSKERWKWKTSSLL